MGTEELALLAAVIRFPDEDVPRLQYADWLMQHGEEERGEFIKIQVAKESMEAAGGTCGSFMKCSCRHCELRDRDNALLGIAESQWFRRLDGAVGTLLRGKQFVISLGEDVLAYRLSRGFISSLTCSADNFLKHHAALIWHPEMTDKLPRCESCGGAEEDERGRWKDKHGHDYWIRCHACKGKSHAPRPCPPTAQPIRKVTLTTNPGLQSGVLGWRLRGASVLDGPFTPYRGGVAHMNADWRESLPLLLKIEFKGIEFDYPAKREVDLALHP